jgi:translation elongation factor EF-Tu-like GTPase
VTERWSCRRAGDGDAGDNIKIVVELIAPIAMEQGPLCHPRGRQNRRRRVVAKVIA